MTEAVVITPQGARNTDGDPVAVGEPFTLHGLVAPGNTTQTPGLGGDLDAADFTIYFPLHIRHEVSPGLWEWVSLSSLLPDDFTVHLRNRTCQGRAQLWDEQGRGGVVVLATSATGKA